MSCNVTFNSKGYPSCLIINRKRENRSKLEFFLPVVLRPNAGHGLLIPEVSRSHTTTHHSR